MLINFIVIKSTGVTTLVDHGTFGS